uniref:SRA stem-loop interacting RNA binding protein n=1 Tax=Takifugu rubripes TaxID=31033 RepID=A0A674PJ42_TAKRU
MAAPSKKVFEVFVSKVPWTVAGSEEYFGQFGSVKKCLLPFDKETGFHKGFCWVGFTSEEGLNNALQKEPHLLEGSKVKPLDLTQLALIFPLYIHPVKIEAETASRQTTGNTNKPYWKQGLRVRG